MKKREIEIAERAIARIALEHHTSVEEVRLQIKIAMLNGLVSDDPKIKAFWDSVPKEGDIPTPEEVIAYIANNISKNKPDGHNHKRRRN